MILDMGNLHSEVVDTIHTHLHTLNIHCLDNLGRSPDLGLVFLVAKMIWVSLRQPIIMEQIRLPVV